MGLQIRRQWSLLLTLVCLFGISQVPAAAQVLYGSLVGTVEDQSGATVPNAKVSITNKSTGFSRDTVTDEGGRYSVASVPGGSYSVKVTATGFKTISRDNVSVTINTVARIDLKLEIGAITDTVTVEASAAVLKTDKSDSSSEISQKVVQNLALNQYRNYQALINLVPGATPAAFQNSATDSPGRALRTNVNGVNANNNNTRLDGATNVNIWLPHQVAYVAPSETVEQVNISTGAFDAEQGMAGGAAITVISASGTNALHGAIWEYHENQRFKSAPYFGRTSTFQKPRYTLNIFGAKAGGAIVKNKLFWFGHYEGTRQGNGGTGQFSVPNDAIKAGNFSGFSTVIYDPRTGNADGTGRTPFVGNIIPANRISPVTSKILPLIPGANSPTANVTNNLFVNGTGKFDRDNFDGKVNWNRNEKHTMFFKFSELKANVGGVNGLGELVGAGVGGDAGTGDTKQYIGTVGTNYTISPSLLFDATWGMQQFDQTVFGSDYGKNYGLDVFGIPGTNGTDPRYSGLPGFTFNTFSNYGQLNTWMPTFRNDRSFTFTTNLSHIKGKHEFRYGFDMVRHQLNHWQPETANPRGQFAFSGNITALRGGAAANNLNSFADFLLGQPTAITKSIQNILMTGREWQFGFYARDRWQLTRNLTLNLGVRIERYPLMTRKDTGLEKLDPSTNLVRLGGYGSVPTNPGIDVDPLFFAPRVGLAYRINDSTVFRIGYGMTIDPLPFSRPLRGFFPLVVTSNNVGTSDFDPFRTLSQGIPALVGPDLSTGSVFLPPTADMRSPMNKINRGYTQSWNATFERKLPGSIIGTVAYVGTQSSNLLADQDINAAPYGAGNAGRPYAALFGRRIATNLWDGWLSSNYHSLQTSVNRSFSKGLLIKGAYTWSKAINMTDDDGWAAVNFNLQSNIGRNRAPAGYDRTHVLQMGWVYELPFGKGRQMMQSGVGAAIVGGWSINGTYSAYSGTPFTLTANAGPLNTPGSLQTADQIAPVNYIGEKGPGQFYFDPKSFRTPQINPAFGANSTIAYFGNTGRNRFRGPGVAKADITLLRQFNVSERMNFQFRAEAYNITNTPLFGNPSTNVDGANFGVVTAASGERQIRLGLRFQF